jgi:hypothetical protein
MASRSPDRGERAEVGYASPVLPFVRTVPDKSVKDIERTTPGVAGPVPQPAVMPGMPELIAAARPGVALGMPVSDGTSPDRAPAGLEIPDEEPTPPRRAAVLSRLAQVALPVRAGAAIVGTVVLATAIMMAATDQQPLAPPPTQVRPAVLHTNKHDMNHMWTDTP